MNRFCIFWIEKDSLESKSDNSDEDESHEDGFDILRLYKCDN